LRLGASSCDRRRQFPENGEAGLSTPQKAGSVTDCIPCRRSIGAGFGQFVVNTTQACQLATAKANVLAVRVLATQAARVLLLQGRSASVLAEQLRTVGQDLAALAQKGVAAADDAQPSLIWSSKELDDICTAVGVAEKTSESATDPEIVAERQQLILVADTIQNAFQGQSSSPDLSPTPIAPGKPGPTSVLTVVAIAASASAAAAGAIWFFTRQR
jgi:hypothetical protein